MVRRDMHFFVVLIYTLAPADVKAGVVFKSGLENVRRLMEYNGGPSVIYAIDDALAPSLRDCIEKGMNEITKYSCVKFIDEKTTPHSNETKLFLRILPSDSSNDCLSHEASFPSSTTNLTLGSICGGQERQCARALLGAFGLAMEHQRPDRGQYVTINRSNAQRESIPLFERLLPLESVEIITEYDVSSIMHFTAQEHSKSESPVINTYSHILDESLGGEIRGHRHLLSHRDKKTLNYIFQCSKTTNQAPASTVCSRNGYLDEKGQCVCPHAFTGERCENLSYANRFNVPTCGTVSDRQGEIVSPNYPNRYSRGAFCQWLIQGKSAQDRIQFRINDLDLEHDHLMPGDRCADKLTIWPHGTDVVTKSLSCLPDEAIKYKGKWYNTQLNWLLIEFRSDPWGQRNHAGFNISYKIIDPPTPQPKPKPSIRRGQSAGKWPAANEKEPFFHDAQENHVGSVKTRLLNTIHRQRQLFCYRCDNETHCHHESIQPITCPDGEACAYHLSTDGNVNWRGCVAVDSCVDSGPSADCQTTDESGPNCFQCCATYLCNTSPKDMQAWSASAPIAQGFDALFKYFPLTYVLFSFAR